MLSAINSMQSKGSLFEQASGGVNLVADIARRSLKSLVALSLVRSIVAQDRFQGVFTGLKFNDNGNDKFICLGTTGGGVILGGNLQEYNGFCDPSARFFVSKFNSSWLPEWVHSVQAQLSMTKIAETTDGGYVLGGVSCKSIDKPLIWKLDNSGKTEWANTIEVVITKYHPNPININDFAVLTDGSFVAAGVDFLSRFGNAGAHYWSKTFLLPTQNDIMTIAALALTQTGSLIVSGTLFNLSENNPSKGFLCLVNSQGSLGWFHTFVANQDSFWGTTDVRYLTTKSDGTIFVAGVTAYNTIDGKNLFLTSWSQTGQLEQVKIITGWEPLSVLQNTDGTLTILLAGSVVIQISERWDTVLSAQSLEGFNGALTQMIQMSPTYQLQIVGSMLKPDCSDTYFPGFISFSSENINATRYCSWTNYSGIINIEGFNFQIDTPTISLVDFSNVTWKSLTFTTKPLNFDLIQNECYHPSPDCSSSSNSNSSPDIPWHWIGIGAGACVGSVVVVGGIVFGVKTIREMSAMRKRKEEQKKRSEELRRMEKQKLIEKPPQQSHRRYDSSSSQTLVKVNSNSSSSEKVVISQQEVEQFIQVFEERFREEYALAVIDAALEDAIRQYLMLMLIGSILSEVNLDDLVKQFASTHQDLVPAGSMPRRPTNHTEYDY